MLEFTGDHSITLCISFVPFLISLLVSFSSALSVIIYQPEEGIYLDGIVNSRIRTYGWQGPASKACRDRQAQRMWDRNTQRIWDRNSRVAEGIATSVCDEELPLYFLFKLPIPP